MKDLCRNYDLLRSANSIHSKNCLDWCRSLDYSECDWPKFVMAGHRAKKSNNNAIVFNWSTGSWHHNCAAIEVQHHKATWRISEIKYLCHRLLSTVATLIHMNRTA
jgi:hypothetical protein